MNNVRSRKHPGEYEVGSLTYKSIGAAGGVVSGVIAVNLLIEHQYVFALLMALFTLLGIYVALCAGRYKLDEESITHKTAFGIYRMRWDEIQIIEKSLVGTEFGDMDGPLLLVGNDKQFSLAPPSVWSGSQKSEARALLRRKIIQSGLVPKVKRSALWKTHKNVKVLQI